MYIVLNTTLRGGLYAAVKGLEVLYYGIYIKIMFKEVVTPFPITESIALAPVSFKSLS